MFSVNITGPGSGPEVLEFDKPEVTLGRHTDNDIVLPKHNISKLHARIRQNGQGAIVVVDNNSTNGTVINGKKISGPTTLQPGDKILVGDYVIDVSTGSSGSGKRAPLPRSLAPKSAAREQRANAPTRPRSKPSPMAFAPTVSEPNPVDASAGGHADILREPAAGIAMPTPSFDDDWDKMEPLDPAEALGGRKPDPDWDTSDTTSEPPSVAPSQETVSLNGPGAPADAAAKANALAECLRLYVEIDEFHQIKAKGMPCHCGDCLLCRSKAALGE